ncbi:MAG: nuclear transport factor 2 family protein [Actinomycetota bacterium]
MSEHPNAAIARESYEAFARGDLQTVGQNITDDVVWHVGGRSPVAGDYKGQDEVFGLFGRLFELSEGTLKLDVHDILADDDHAVALVTMSADRNGKHLDMRSVHVMNIQEGRTREFWAFDEDQAADDAFWS